MKSETSHSDSEHEITDGLFIKVFIALAVLTGITFGLSVLGFPQEVRHLGAALIAIVKAGLVAMFFMHLKFDKRYLTYIFVFPFLLAILFTLMISPDIGIKLEGS